MTWDAWNRLIKVADGANTVAEYAYDGLNRRIVKAVYDGGVLDHTEHFYLSEDNQVLEVRKDLAKGQHNAKQTLLKSTLPDYPRTRKQLSACPRRENEITLTDQFR